MGFDAVKQKALGCLKAGLFRHEERAGLLEKNLLFAGQLSIDDVVRAIGTCRGDCYKISRHHRCRNIDVHEFKALGRFNGLYIKFYFIEPDMMFISVHY